MVKVTQKEIQGIYVSESAGLNDIQLVEKIIGLRQDKKRIQGALAKSTSDLAQRLIDAGVEELDLGDQIIAISPKLLNEYDIAALNGLRNCATDDQAWLVLKQLPSGKQLKELSFIAGASAKAVITSARRKIDTGTMLVKIKKPKKTKRR